MYDFAQKISHLRFGWMILGAILSTSRYNPLSTSLTQLCSCHFLPSMYWTHHHRYIMWLRVRDEGVLRRRCGLSVGIRNYVCCPQATLQQETEEMVLIEREVAGT